MQPVKIGLANLDPTVGAIPSNLERLIEMAAEMSANRCAIGVFTEQVIPGYPTEDLVQWRGFVEQQGRALERFAEATGALTHPTIFALGLSVADRGFVYNAVAVVAAGQIVGLVPKEHLPTYGVFYESRVFARGIPGETRTVLGAPFGDLLFRAPFGVFTVEVCEDMWVADGPLLRRSASGAELVLNLSASPWRTGIAETRRELIATRASDNQVTFVYVNQVGGQDSLVFDGGAYVNQNGRLLHEAERWREGWSSFVVDLDRTRRLRFESTTWRASAEAYLRTHPPVRIVEVDIPDSELRPEISPSKNFFVPEPGPKLPPEKQWYEDLVAAMRTGLDGYFRKTGAFDKLGIAVSGGKDSSLTLVIAWLYARERFRDLPEKERRARIRDFICCFSMPTRFNSPTTRAISTKLCAALGVSFREVPIEDAFEREVEAAQAMLGPSEELPALTRQNIQARIRAQRMWNWANATRALWIQTGNMSEKAVGYTTIGGDLMGAYSLLGNLPKTIVIRLLGYLRKKHDIEVLDELLETKASAELAENQEDEKDLMPFPVLDACFALFAGEKLMPVELYSALRATWTDEELKRMRPDYRPGMLKDWVKRFCGLFIGSIFKWVQAPQSVHLGNLDLDRERALQLPAVQSREWLDLEALDALSD
ncbi:MAG TPA: NAD(+) synthase [Vicinamibacteria bacterium]|nr:NAD(+) synthase [Vicinamibacteria bacterium]